MLGKVAVGSRRAVRALAGMLGVMLALAPVSCTKQSAVVTAAMSDVGLKTLNVGGTEFLANGEFRVHKVLMRRDNGATFEADLASTASVDQAARSLTRRYGWGSVQVQYAPVGNRLEMTITTNNRSPYTIQGLFIEPVELKFPTRIAEYDGNSPLVESNLSGPTLVKMSYGSGVLVYANEDPSKPLMSGFPWALDRPASTVFPLLVNTDRQKMYPDFFPAIDRPIPPGGSDQYHLSLRFGQRGATIEQLADDVVKKYTAQFPQRLQWPDRRPIGTIFLASAGLKLAGNPRGFLNNPNIEVSSPVGVARLKQDMLALADKSIRILQDMDAQGVLVWDIEGQEFPRANYVGDPRQYASAAPEMATIADEFFARFREAGLRVGVCVRPQEFKLDPRHKGATQTSSNDPLALLKDKIEFAKKRWGATLFYVDSNGGPNDPISPAIFEKLAAMYPDTLLIPEHKNLRYHAYTAPYRELRQGFAATPLEIRRKNPAFFSVINTADGPIEQKQNELVAAVRQGDILLFRTWYNDEPANSKVRAIYKQAKKP